MFKSRASQWFDSLVQVSIVVDIPNDRLVRYEPFREEPIDGGKFHVESRCCLDLFLAGPVFVYCPGASGLWCGGTKFSEKESQSAVGAWRAGGKNTSH